MKLTGEKWYRHIYSLLGEHIFHLQVISIIVEIIADKTLMKWSCSCYTKTAGRNIRTIHTRSHPNFHCHKLSARQLQVGLSIAVNNKHGYQNQAIRYQLLVKIIDKDKSKRLVRIIVLPSCYALCTLIFHLRHLSASNWTRKNHADNHPS